MAYTAQDIKRLCKGRTEEQKQVIKYFLGGGGCLSSTLTDEQYDLFESILDKANGINVAVKEKDKTCKKE